MSHVMRHKKNHKEIKMSALSYFLNEGYDTMKSTYALGCIGFIDKALDGQKRKIKYRPKEMVDIDEESAFGSTKRSLPDSRSIAMVEDLLESFYYNERKIGIVIESDFGKKFVRTVHILNLEDYQCFNTPIEEDSDEDSDEDSVADDAAKVSDADKSSNASKASTFVKNYQYNRKVWYKLCKTIIKDGEGNTLLPKPTNMIPMDLRMELYLAYDISKQLEVEYKHFLFRGTHGRWFLLSLLDT